MSIEPIPFDESSIKVGDYVLEHDETQWIVYGTGRYAPGGRSHRTRERGLSVRPIDGGRARVLSCHRFARMVPANFQVKEARVNGRDPLTERPLATSHDLADAERKAGKLEKETGRSHIVIALDGRMIP